MPQKQKINLEKVKASLNTLCPKCGYSIPPARDSQIMHFATFLPEWNSLEAVRHAHSLLEGGALICFALLVLFDVLAHLSEDENKGRARLFEKIGLFFFAVAILAEIAAYPYGERNDKLSADMIGSLSEKAGQAETKAKQALTDSGTALTNSAAALTRSGEAVTKADAANDSAGKAQQKVVVAMTALSELQARMAWRTVSDAQRKKLRDELQPFRGHTINLNWDGTDPEQNTFGPQLFEAFQNAGLIVKPDVAGLNILSPVEMAVTGILIEGNDDRFMEGLAKALVCSSLANRPVPMVHTDRPDGSLEVRIRPKGQQIIDKNAAKCND